MSKVKEAYPEIENIQQDLSSLKDNTVELARHVKADGTEHASVLTEKAHKMIADLKTQGAHEFEKIEQRVKDKPGQSVAIAFAAGIVASYLLGRR